jgi:hypothetical protein
MKPESDDEEETSAGIFFELFEESTVWSLPHGDELLELRRLYQLDAEPCTTLIVVFSSTNAHFDFEGSFARLRDRTAQDRMSALFVTDHELTWFLRDSESGDPYGPVIKLVAAEVARLQPKNLATIGYCRGGYAAVRAGVALGAARIFALSPQV